MIDNNFDEIFSQLEELKRLILLTGKNVLSFTDVMLLTGFSRGHLYKLVSQKKIPYYKPFGKDLFFKREEVEEWLMQNRVCTIDELQLLSK